MSGPAVCVPCPVSALRPITDRWHLSVRGPMYPAWWSHFALLLFWYNRSFFMVGSTEAVCSLPFFWYNMSFFMVHSSGSTEAVCVCSLPLSLLPQVWHRRVDRLRAASQLLESFAQGSHTCRPWHRRVRPTSRCFSYLLVKIRFFRRLCARIDDATVSDRRRGVQTAGAAVDTRLLIHAGGAIYKISVKYIAGQDLQSRSL